MTDLPATELSASTRLCAVLGHPIRHSASPAMQNAGIAALGLDWRYVAFDVHPDHLRQAIEGARAMRFVGLNLTVPHKLLAMDMVDALDETARQWGAVNTIRFEARMAGGEWRPVAAFEDDVPAEVRAVGFNTDADGLLRALREDLDFEPLGSRVVLLGAGGAGRVAALKLAAERAAQLFLLNRTRAKAEALATEISARYPKVKVEIGYPDSRRVDLLLNATSLGLKRSDPIPMELTRLPLNQVDAVYDMVYRPAFTRLLEAARATGCRVANGLGMLLHQGTRALEVWTGRPAPAEAMRQALRRNVYGV